MSEHKKQKLYVMIGIPGSGKTTLSHSMIEKLGDGTVHVSRDAVRLEVGDVKFSKASESVVYKEYISRIITWLKMGYDVIADATNLSVEKRYIYFAVSEIMERLGLAHIDVVAVHVATPLSVCIDRNDKREPSEYVPENVIESMYSKIQEPEYDEGFVIIMNK